MKLKSETHNRVSFIKNFLCSKYIVNKFITYWNIDPHLTGYYYFFITKPELNLNDKNISNNSFFSYIFRAFPFLKSTLSALDSGSDGLFIKLLSNVFLGGETKETQLSTLDVGETLHGYRVVLGNNMLQSFQNGTLTINYKEVSPPIVAYLHRAWIEYINGVRFGTLLPTRSHITKKILDYVSTIYIFCTEPDGMTLRYWTRYCGVFPTTASFENFVDSDIFQKNIKECRITYAYTVRDDMTLNIINAFNTLSDNSVMSALQFHSPQIYTSVSVLPKSIKEDYVKQFSNFSVTDNVVSYNSAKVLYDNEDRRLKLLFTNSSVGGMTLQNIGSEETNTYGVPSKKINFYML